MKPDSTESSYKEFMDVCRKHHGTYYEEPVKQGADNPFRMKTCVFEDTIPMKQMAEEIKMKKDDFLFEPFTIKYFSSGHSEYDDYDSWAEWIEFVSDIEGDGVQTLSAYKSQSDSRAGYRETKEIHEEYSGNTDKFMPSDIDFILKKINK